MPQMIEYIRARVEAQVRGARNASRDVPRPGESEPIRHVASDRGAVRSNHRGLITDPAANQERRAAVMEIGHPWVVTKPPLSSEAHPGVCILVVGHRESPTEVTG